MEVARLLLVTVHVRVFCRVRSGLAWIYISLFLHGHVRLLNCTFRFFEGYGSIWERYCSFLSRYGSIRNCTVRFFARHCMFPLQLHTSRSVGFDKSWIIKCGRCLSFFFSKLFSCAYTGYHLVNKNNPKTIEQFLFTLMTSINSRFNIQNNTYL